MLQEHEKKSSHAKSDVETIERKDFVYIIDEINRGEVSKYLVNILTEALKVLILRSDVDLHGLKLQQNLLFQFWIKMLLGKAME